MTKHIFPGLSALRICTVAMGQKKIDNTQLDTRIAFYKNDIRGSYKDIR